MTGNGMTTPKFCSMLRTQAMWAKVLSIERPRSSQLSFWNSG